MKTKEELNALKEEVETLSKKLAELTEDELKQVSGGNLNISYDSCGVTRSQYTVIEKERYYINEALTECVIVKDVTKRSNSQTVFGFYAYFTITGSEIRITGYYPDVFNINESVFRDKYHYVLG